MTLLLVGIGEFVLLQAWLYELSDFYFCRLWLVDIIELETFRTLDLMVRAQAHLPLTSFYLAILRSIIRRLPKPEAPATSQGSFRWELEWLYARTLFFWRGRLRVDLASYKVHSLCELRWHNLLVFFLTEGGCLLIIFAITESFRFDLLLINL